jgi:hypothetical protein
MSGFHDRNMRMIGREAAREPVVLRDGKLFHLDVQREWEPVDGAEAEVVLYDTAGRRRRIDILVRVDAEMVSVVEIKNTDWDRIADGRVRPNALRHARQVWAYVEPFLDFEQVAVCPGIIYRRVPKKAGRLLEVEKIHNERGIQVVWQDETIPDRKARADREPLT